MVKPRPLLRYHGGKWMLAPWIIKHFPKHRFYTECFGGAASVLLRKPRAYSEIYNDLDGELCNLFCVVRDRGSELKDKLRLTPFARREFLLSYESTPDPLEQARRTIVRSFMGFGSNAHNKKTGFRANSNQSGTTPAHDWKNYPDALEIIIDRLQGVVIENREASEILSQHDNHETLHYVDPPYLCSTRGLGTDYIFEMDNCQHEQLARVLHNIQGMVVLSAYPSELYDRLYRDWSHVKHRSLADGARKRVEILWFNPVAWQKLNQFLFDIEQEIEV